MSVSREELEAWFQGFDKDGSGKIDASELRSVVKEYREWQSLPLDDESVDADVGGILAAADTSGDGKIDKSEFVNFFAS